jgi:hypothetical protein
LGGGLINDKVIPLDKVRTNLSYIMSDYPYIPDVVRSKLGDKAGLLGALSYLKSR